MGAEDDTCSPRERPCWGPPPGSRAVSPKKAHPLFHPCTQRALKNTHTHQTHQRGKKKKVKVKSRLTLCEAMDCSLPGSLTQGLNPGLPNCRQTLYHLSHQGSLPMDYSLIFNIFKLPIASSIKGSLCVYLKKEEGKILITTPQKFIKFGPVRDSSVKMACSCTAYGNKKKQA